MAAGGRLFERDRRRDFDWRRQRPGGQERVVSCVDDKRGYGDGLQHGLGGHLLPVVFGIVKAMQPRGDQGVEFAEGSGSGNRLRIEQVGKARGLEQGLGFQSDEEARGVDAAVEATVEGVAGRGEIERRGDGGGALDQQMRRVALFTQPFQQGIAAERDAGRVNRRIGVLRFDVMQDASDVCAVTGEIGARQPVVLTRAAAEMRHHAMPATRPHVGHEVARVVAVGTAFQAMEQHHHRRASRAVDPVEIQEVAIRQFQPFAPVGDRRDADEQAAVDGLQMPAG